MRPPDPRPLLRVIVGLLVLSALLTAVADLIFYTTGHKGQPVRLGEVAFDFVPLIVAVVLLRWNARAWSFAAAGVLLTVQPILDLFYFNTPASIAKTDNLADASIYALVTVALVLAVACGVLGFARARAWEFSRDA